MNEKKRFLLGVSACVLLAMQTDAQVRHEIRIPDIGGYQTLKCDFHTHTVFSDGLVWPTVRVDEAYREGLDVLSLTDHIEYRPHSKDINAHHGRSWEIAKGTAELNGILLIRGSEITRSMAPGHFNAIFLSDCNPLDVFVNSNSLFNRLTITRSFSPSKKYFAPTFNMFKGLSSL